MERDSANATVCRYRLDADCVVGERTAVGDDACIICGSVVGTDCAIGRHAHLEGTTVGDRCTVQAYAYLPPGVTLEDEVFVGPHTCFTNDPTPGVARTGDLSPATTRVRTGAVIGANATIGPGVIIGARAFVAAGAIVVKDVPDGATVYGHTGLCISYGRSPDVLPYGGPDGRGDDWRSTELMPGGEV